jgi:hypothetical protein
MGSAHEMEKQELRSRMEAEHESALGELVPQLREVEHLHRTASESLSSHREHSDRTL